MTFSLRLIIRLQSCSQFRFCLLNPQCHGQGSNFKAWGNWSCISSLLLINLFVIPCIDEFLKFLNIACLKMTHSSFSFSGFNIGSSSPLSVILAEP